MQDIDEAKVEAVLIARLERERQRQRAIELVRQRESRWTRLFWDIDVGKTAAIKAREAS